MGEIITKTKRVIVNNINIKRIFSAFIDKHYAKVTKLKEPDETIGLHSLSPSILREPENSTSKIYVDGLFWGICNKDIKNIALMGSYGTGKSSIIKTLKSIKKDELPVHITVSLATFEVDEEVSTAITNEQISMNIVNQILYSKKKSDLSESRFKRIEYLSIIEKVCYSVILLFFVYSFCYIFLPEVNDQVAFLPHLGIFTDLFFRTIFISGLGILIWKSISFLINIRISKVSPTSIEISSKENTENINALDKYFDEILYFFQATKTKVVFIEDLDRFPNSLRVFTKLRELNFLLNQSEDLDGNITFIYAVKDDIISNHNNKTKFFDLIISIVPYINYSNSRDIFKKKILETDSTLGSSEELIDLVNLVSKYIEDTRTVLTIINDYLIMSQSLGMVLESENIIQSTEEDESAMDAESVATEEDKSDIEVVSVAIEEDKSDIEVESMATEEDKSDTEVESVATEEDKSDTEVESVVAEEDKPDIEVESVATEKMGLATKESIDKKIKFLAFVIYKTLYPQDFSLLLQRDGVLFSFFSSKPELLNKISKNDRDNLNELENDLAHLESNKNDSLKDLVELRRVFISGLLEYFDYNQEEVKKSFNISNLNDLLEKETFEEKFIDFNISYWNSYRFGNLKFSDIEKKINVNYQDRYDKIILLDEIKLKEGEIREIKKRIEECETLTVKDLYLTYGDVVSVYLKEKISLFTKNNQKNEQQDTGKVNLDKDKDKENYKVLALLLEEGYINESFIRYVSFNHGEGVLSIEDDKFLDKFDNNLNDFTYNVSNPKVLLQDLSKHHFKQFTILNQSLLQEIYGVNSKKYINYKFALMQAFSHYFHQIAKEFFKEDVQYLLGIWNDLIGYSVYNTILTNKELGQEEVVKLLNGLSNSSKDMLDKLKTDELFRKFICDENNNYLNKIDSDTFKKIVVGLDYIIQDCSLIEDNKKLGVVVKNNTYLFDVNNVEYLVSNVGDILDAYEAYSLTNVLDNDKNVMFRESYLKQANGKISENKYIKEYIERLEKNTDEIKESQDIVVNNLFMPEQGELTDNELDIVCSKVHFKIADITSLNWRNSFKLLLFKDRIKMSWSNLEDYFKRSNLKEFDESLVTFVQKNLDKESAISGFDSIDNDIFKYALVNSKVKDSIVLRVLEKSNFILKDLTRIVFDNKYLITEIIKLKKIDFSKDVYRQLDEEQRLLYLLCNVKNKEDVITLNLDYRLIISPLANICNNKYPYFSENYSEESKLVYTILTEHLITHYATDINFGDNEIAENVYKALEDNIDIETVEIDQYDYLLNNILSSGISKVTMKKFLEFFLSKTSDEKIEEYCKRDVEVAFNYLDILIDDRSLGLIHSVVKTIVDDNYKTVLTPTQIHELIRILNKCPLTGNVISSYDLKRFLENQLVDKNIDLNIKSDLILSLEKYMDNDDLIACLEFFDLPINDIKVKSSFVTKYIEEKKRLLYTLRLRLGIKTITGVKSEDEKDYQIKVEFNTED
ncbi:YobI family P-loop NTPase [Myroides profundi]|uniref:YobI-like P-loop NTPase domain-containing protein n=1 Tax=Myroides profundi TaxID=480520 RepID=A0AAJ5BEE0_MYRPR|nr:hypothetical protein [Myroides profundi]AJH15493.1 hypothetical protein MPR_2322 [Myroides profundi]SER08984.1 hypothetical protein SAMN04488089_10972 [Myroides profundi]